MKHNKIHALATMFLLIVAMMVQAVMPAQAAVGKDIGVEIVGIRVNNLDDVNDGETVQTRFLRGETLDIDVKIKATKDVENLRVKARVDGYEHGSLSEESELFDITFDEPDVTAIYDYISVEMTLPKDMDQDRYRLEIEATNRDGSVSNNYYLKIDTKYRDIEILDTTFYPGLLAKPGGFTGVVRLENTGEKDDLNTKVEMSIPELRLVGTDYIDDFEADDIKSSEPIYLRIPECTQPGTYTVNVDVTYNDGHDTVSRTYDLEILEGDLCDALQDDGTAPKTTVLLEKEIQDIQIGGKGAVYPVSLVNQGTTVKSYVLSVSGAESFADVEINPSNVVVLEPSKTKVVTVQVDALETAIAGTHAFTLDIKAGDEVIQQIALVANVMEEESSVWDTVKTVLLVLVLLVVLGAVGVAVIVAFNRARENREGDFGPEEVPADTEAVGYTDEFQARTSGEPEEYY